MIIPLGGYVRTQLWGIFNKICEISVILYGVFWGLDMNAIFTTLACVLFVYSIFVIYDVKRLLPEYYPWWSFGSLKEGFRNFRISLVITFSSFLEQFTTTSLNSLISNLFSKTVIPSYTTIKTVSNLMTQLTYIILQPIQSDFIGFHFNQDRKKIVYILYINWFLFEILFFIPMLIFLPFLKPLYELWTNGKISYNESLTIAILSSVIIYNFGRAMIYYLSVINDLRALLVNNIFRFLIMLPSSFILGWYFNSLTTLCWGLTIGEFFGSIVLPYIYVVKHLSTSFSNVDYYMHLGCTLLMIVLMVLNSIVFNFFILGISIVLLLLMIYFTWQKSDNLFKEFVYSKIKHLLSKVRIYPASN